MSHDNVQLVHKLIRVYNERSFADNLDLIEPDIVWDLSRVEVPDGSTYAGRLELSGFVETWEEGFESDRFEVEEIIDAGARVVAMVRHSGRGKVSHIEVDQRFAMVWTLSDGRAARMDAYPTREKALEAVGLR